MKKRRIIKYTILSFFLLIMITFATFSVILHSRITSMMSIKKKGESLYTMNYKKNYHLDKALKAGITNEEELLDFICDEMFFGYKIDADFSKYGCSAFLTKTPNGDNIVCRNFDLLGTDTLSVYTNPSNGYASVSTVSTDMVGVGGKDGLKETSLKGRIALLASPYIAVDGVNEKGLSASLLDMCYGETHMLSDKPDIIITMAIRLLLDKAANIEEAINLLKQYNIHSAHGSTQHIFIADKSGRSVIVEWYKLEMNIVEYNCCTNFVMSEPIITSYTGLCDRFDIIDGALKEKNINTIEESMDLLEKVKQKSSSTHTIWSVIYNLNDFSVNYCVDLNYDDMYHLNPKKN